MCTSNQQAKRDLWMSRIMACRQSGLPDVRWCKENGVTPSSLYYWINKFRDEAIIIPDSNSEPAIPYEQDVVPLHIIEKETPETSLIDTPAIVLHMGSITLDIHNGADETTIRSAVQALRQLC